MQFKLDIFGVKGETRFIGYSFWDSRMHNFKIFIVDSDFGYQVWNSNLVIGLSGCKIKK